MARATEGTTNPPGIKEVNNGSKSNRRREEKERSEGGEITREGHGHYRVFVHAYTDGIHVVDYYFLQIKKVD